MDKEILRIVIIATGLVVVIGMLVWAYIKDKNAQDELEFYDDYGNESKLTDPNDLNDDLDIAPLAAAKSNLGSHYDRDKLDHYYDDDEDDDYFEPVDDTEPPARAPAPAIIQFSIITKADEDFNGADLVEAFEIVGLEYGALKIYERLDTKGLVDFGVACIVEPGTFPEKDLDQFYCPGSVFFMQPEALDDALAVFDDYIDTIHLLAAKLDGVILDHRRQPLTEATIQSIRQSL
jgi:cell division protein ZipA